MALATDYDCWHPDHDNVDVMAVIQTLQANVALAKRVVELAAGAIPDEPDPMVEGAAKWAVMTRKELIPPGRREALEPIIGRYLDE